MLKEQVIRGGAFKNIAEWRKAAMKFVDRYNNQWRLEKAGFMDPVEARKAHMERLAA